MKITSKKNIQSLKKNLWKFIIHVELWMKPAAVINVLLFLLRKKEAGNHEYNSQKTTFMSTWRTLKNEQLNNTLKNK